MLHGTCRQHFTQKQDTQPARTLLEHLAKTDTHIRLVERLHTTEAISIFTGFFCHGIQHIIDSYNADDVAAVINDRNGKQIVFTKQTRDILAIRMRRDRDWIIIAGK
ncbi:hypothetical protein D9M68_861590 [compost metagenome]